MALRVLESFPPPRETTNPYIVMLADALRSRTDVRLETFTWRKALLTRFDVFHVHWPENLVTGRSGIKKMARQVLFWVLLVLLRIRRTAVVRTVHNLEPHDQLKLRERWLLAGLERQTVRRILLNGSSADLVRSSDTVILHGHYISWFSKAARCEAEPGRLQFAGLIRPYKNLPHLIDVFRRLEDPNLRLSISGRASPEALGALVTQRSEGDGRIELDLQYLTDEALVTAVSRAELVVLPYTEMYNSGALIMALSLERPVLVPDNPVTDALAREVGSGWVHLYPGDLNENAIVDTLDALRTRPPSRPPDLSAREWALAGEQHVDVFRAAVTQRTLAAREEAHHAHRV